MNNKSFNFVGKLKFTLAISVAVMVIALAFMIVSAVTGNGMLNLGIDFTGGTQLSVEIGDAVEKSGAYADLTKATENYINEMSGDASVKFGEFRRSGADNTAGFVVTFSSDDETLNSITEAINSTTSGNSLKDALLETLNSKYYTDTPYDEVNITVSPETILSTSSDLLITYTFIALAVALVLMLIYIWIRFELASGIVVMLMLVHDIFIMIGLTAIFRIQVNTTFVAALITIVGYSINNEIITFDRVRENMKKYNLSGKPVDEIINISIRESLKRNIFTSCTTLFTILALCIFGVTSIREFALPIIFGLVAGLYSVIFIGASCYANFKTWSNKRKEEKERLAKNPAAVAAK